MKNEVDQVHDYPEILKLSAVHLHPGGLPPRQLLFWKVQKIDIFWLGIHNFDTFQILNFSREITGEKMVRIYCLIFHAKVSNFS